MGRSHALKKWTEVPDFAVLFIKAIVAPGSAKLASSTSSAVSGLLSSELGWLRKRLHSLAAAGISRILCKTTV